MLGVCCGSLYPDGCAARAITRAQSSSAISDSTGPTSGRQSGDRQGMGMNLVDSVLHLLCHPMGTAEPLGSQ